MNFEIRNKIENIYAEYCGRKVEYEEEVMDSGLLSSMKLFDLICEVESVFDIQFEKCEMTNIDNFRTIKNVVFLIEAKLKGEI